MRFICYLKEILWLQQTLFALVMLEHVQLEVVRMRSQLSFCSGMLKRGLVLYRDNEISSNISDNIESSDSEGESMSESESGS